VPERESIRSFAAHGASMAIYLSTSLLTELTEELLAGGFTEETPAAIVYKATWPEERICRCTVGTLAKTAEEACIKKTAVILVGDVIGAKSFEESRLYSPDFSTEFRKAKL